MITVAIPQDFGALGDGAADDTEALRAWSAAIAGGMGFVPPGVYCYSASWTIQSQTRIDGSGKGSAIFKCTEAAATIINSNPRWSPVVDPVGGGDPNDRDIAISNVCFQGDANAVVPGSANFVTFIGVNNLVLRDVRFKDRRLDLLVLHNCRDVLMDACEFTNWGDNRPNPNPGSGQYVGGTALFCWEQNGLIRVVNCIAHDSDGGLGLWLGAARAVLIGNVVQNVDEACLVGFGPGSIVAGNCLGRVRRKDVSGHNTEAAGGEYVYIGNYHADAAGANAYFSNLQNVPIVGNLLVRANQAQAGETSSLTLASHGAWAGVGDKPPDCVTIAANVCCDPNSNATHAVHVIDMGGGPMAHVYVTDNNTGASQQWDSRPVQTERKGVTVIHNVTD